MKMFFVIAALASTLSACAPTALPLPEPQKTGVDRDSQGCLGSAGYTWSGVRAQCIRIFEVGLAFEPDPVPTQEAVLRAFVVLSPAEGAVSAAEVFVPGHQGPIALHGVRVAPGEGHLTVLANESEGVRLLRDRDGHVLDVRGQRYRRTHRVADQLERLD